MKIKTERLYKIIDQISDWRTEARCYPIYRVIERTARVTIWAGIIAGITAIIGSPELTWTTTKIAIGSGIAAGIDKLKNEYANFRREYDITRWDTIKQLFHNDLEW